MRIEVRTCNQVRLMLNLDTVKSQRRIINGDSVHCQVTLVNGKILDLEKPISDFHLEPDIDITKKFLKRLNQSMLQK